jgi:hypothetical protein
VVHFASLDYGGQLYLPDGIPINLKALWGAGLWEHLGYDRFGCANEGLQIESSLLFGG